MKPSHEPGTSHTNPRNPLYMKLSPVAAVVKRRDTIPGKAFANSHWRLPDSGTRRLAGWLVAVAVCTCLTGCFGFLKPAKSYARRYVLTPLPAAGPTASGASTLGVGVARVKLPAYLFDSSIVVRKGTNEVHYLPLTLWAERLDNGLQRVLAADLSVLLPTDRVRLSAWQVEDISVEVHVAIGQFDVDESGRGVLVAWWRILAPGGEKVLKAGESRSTSQGPSPEADPSGAVATMSELVGDLSRQLAQAIRESVTTVRPATK
jgi:uncharacterized protein